MKVFDVNTLIYAHRCDQMRHEFYREKLESLLQGQESCGLTTVVATAFVRIVTQPTFPNGPTSLAQALAVIESLTAPGYCQWLHPGTRHWEITAELCRKIQCTGKKVSDASHAALAIEHGCTLVSRDDDFQHFVPHGLRWEKW